MDESSIIAEREPIKLAALDYVEGVYDVDPSRIERSVHPSLNKGGFFEERTGGSYRFTTMTLQRWWILASTPTQMDVCLKMG